MKANNTRYVADTKYIAGIDYSIGGPAVCVHPQHEEWDISNCRFLFMTSVKKRTGDFGNGQFRGVKFRKDFKYDVERFSWNAETFMDFMDEYYVTETMIEGYAFSSNGKVFNLAENCGILKKAIVDAGLDLNHAPPSVFKKFATGKGNANKEKMVEAFVQETGLDLVTMFELNKVSNPVDDLVDAYFICKYLHEINN